MAKGYAKIINLIRFLRLSWSIMTGYFRIMLVVREGRTAVLLGQEDCGLIFGSKRGLVP
jgi:hypothetical protein